MNGSVRSSDAAIRFVAWLSKVKSAFSEQQSLVFSTALLIRQDELQRFTGSVEEASAGGAWVENHPCWFVMDRKGILTYAAYPSLSPPTSYVKEVDDMLEALRKRPVNRS